MLIGAVLTKIKSENSDEETEDFYQKLSDKNYIPQTPFYMKCCT